MSSSCFCLLCVSHRRRKGRRVLERGIPKLTPSVGGAEDGLIICRRKDAARADIPGRK